MTNYLVRYNAAMIVYHNKRLQKRLPRLAKLAKEIWGD